MVRCNLPIGKYCFLLIQECMHDDAVTGRCEFLLFKYFALKNEYISLYLYISWGFKRKQLYIYEITDVTRNIQAGDVTHYRRYVFSM